MNWVLIVVLLIFAYCLIRGYQKGLLRILYSMVSWILIFVIVSCATPYINDFIRNHTTLYMTIAQRCEEKLQQTAHNELETTAEEQQTQQLESLGINLPTPLLENMLQKTTDAADNILQESGIYTQVAIGLADFAVKGLSSLLAWILAGLVVSILSHLLGIVSKIPIIKGVNRYMGVAAGGCYALLLVWTIFYVTALCGGSEFGAGMIAYIYENPLLILLYENNLVLTILCFYL